MTTTNEFIQDDEVLQELLTAAAAQGYINAGGKEEDGLWFSGKINTDKPSFELILEHDDTDTIVEITNEHPRLSDMLSLMAAEARFLGTKLAKELKKNV